MEWEHPPSLGNQQSVVTTGLEKLPSEVLVMIMRSLDDLQALHALLSTSSYLYHSFKAARLSIIWSVLYHAVGDLMPFACGAVLAPGRVFIEMSKSGPHAAVEVEIFEDFLKPHRQVPQLLTDGDPSLLLSLCRMHNCVATWTERIWQSVVIDHDFRGVGRECHCSLQARFPTSSQETASPKLINPAKVMESSYAKVTCRGHDVLSRKEAFRIRRAFYRFEIFSHIFGGSYNIQCPQSNIFKAFFSEWPPWEIEEFFCVHQFLQHRFNAYTDSGLRSWYPGKVRMGQVKRNSPTTSSSASAAHTNLFKGLELARDIFHQRTIRRFNPYEICNLPARVLRESMCSSSIALRESMLPSFRRALDKHDELGPSFCWAWVHDQRDEHLMEKDEWFRDWSYAFWDEPRCLLWGFGRIPFQHTDYQQQQLEVLNRQAKFRMMTIHSSRSRFVCSAFGLRGDWTPSSDLLTFPPGMPKELQAGLLKFLGDIDFTRCQHCERPDEVSRAEGRDGNSGILRDGIYVDVFISRKHPTFTKWLARVTRWKLPTDWGRGVRDWCPAMFHTFYATLSPLAQEPLWHLPRSYWESID